MSWRRSRSPWTAEELEHLPAVLNVLQVVAERPRGLGACWPDLRVAEAALAIIAEPARDAC